MMKFKEGDVVFDALAAQRGRLEELEVYSTAEYISTGKYRCRSVSKGTAGGYREEWLCSRSQALMLAESFHNAGLAEIDAMRKKCERE